MTKGVIVGDTWSGTCTGHSPAQAVTGVVLSGSDIMSYTGDAIPVVTKAVAREGDEVSMSCTHTHARIKIGGGTTTMNSDGTPIVLLGAEIEARPGNPTVTGSITSASSVIEVT